MNAPSTLGGAPPESGIGPFAVDVGPAGLRSVTFGVAPAAPPCPAALALVGRIARHVAGATDRFADVPLDLADARGGPVRAFAAAVYATVRGIPPGRVATYGAVAAALGRPGAARAVGRALARNPFPVIVPCHRVVAHDGRLGGFTAPGGLATKVRLLTAEGVTVTDGVVLPGAALREVPCPAP